MKIEKAIKQSKPFNSAYEKVGVNLMYTHNIIVHQLRLFFKAFQVTLKQYNILRILRGAEKPVSTSFIKERLLDKNSDVSRIVDRMEAKNIVKKRVCETDKRLVDVELTAKGIDLLNLINQEMNVMESFFNNITPEEADTLNELLDKIRGNK